MPRRPARPVLTALAMVALVAAILSPFGARRTAASSQDDGRDACASGSGRPVEISTAGELEAALANARPGDLIRLEDGTYDGTFVADRSGTADAPIALCGTRRAVIDGGDFENGYALHLTADHWVVQGITITNALKGVMLDDADFNLLDRIAVHAIGHEAVHFRTHSSDNVIQDSEIFDTGLKKAKFWRGCADPPPPLLSGPAPCGDAGRLRAPHPAR